MAEAVHITPSPFVRVALRLFRPLATRRIVQHPQLSRSLAQARDPLVPVAYLSAVYLRALLAFFLGLFVLASVLVGTGGVGEAEPRVLTAAIVAPVLFSSAVYSFYLLRPDLQKQARRRDLESNLPYALNFLAALAAAGVVPDELFGALGRQSVYGEVAREASMVQRDTKLFSRDLVTAMRDAARRSPSQQFEEFLQGAINTVTSGGDLKTYFLAKAEQFGHENHRRQRAFLEGMGVMAESYVVVAAAAPLFLIVIISVMVLLQQGLDAVFFLNLIVLGVMPIVHATFAYILRTMRPD